MDKPYAVRVLSRACVLSAVLAFASWAQEETDAALDGATADTAVAEVQTITVTGSRIPRSPDFVQTNPVVSVNAEDFRQSGNVKITDYLKELPALTGSIGSNAAGGSNAAIGLAGLNLLDLRNLGFDRTLVLVDGKRHVGSVAGTGAVDVESIPVALIERIDIQTGGVSAVYGADAVSGVVNFVMKRDFEGLDVRTQFGQSSEGDADTALASIVGGRNFLGGRLNLAGAYEYSKSDRLSAYDRSFAGGGERRFLVNNPADFQPDDDPNVPDRVPLSDIRYNDSARDGYVLTFDPDFNFLGDFSGRGQVWDPGLAIPDSFFQQGGDGTSLDDYIGDLTPEVERHTLSSFLTFDVTDRIRLTGDLKYAQSESFTEGQPSFDFFLPIEQDNPFIPQSVVDATGPEDFIFVSRDHFDLGVRQDDIERDTFRGVLGLEAQITDAMQLETSLVYGRTKIDSVAINNRYNDRFAAALDSVIDPATGQPTCRSNLDPDAVPFSLSDQGWDVYEPLPGTWAGSFMPGPDSGCVPFSPFAEADGLAAAAPWLMTNSLTTYRLEQTVVTAAITGTTFNWFVPDNSEMAYAFGVEHRVEESRGNPPIEDQRGLTFGNVIQPDSGRYDVSEFFFEFEVPLLENLPFAERVSVEAAMRFSDYNTIGRTRTWKGGASWAPVSDVTFRATRAKATRAPNIGELFDPGGQTFRSIADPCAAVNLNNGTSFRAANCFELLSSLGVEDPANFVDEASSFLPGVSRGNRDLQEEDAFSTTIGVVLTPEFVPGLSVALDWYDIEIENAVFAPQGAEIARQCVDAPTLDNQFCPLITREAGTATITDFQEIPVNVARFTTRGYDLSVQYRIDPADWGIRREIGRFDLRLIGNKLENLTFFSLPGAEPDSVKGEGQIDSAFGEAPEWQAQFDLRWYYRRVTLGYGFSYFDETFRFTKETLAGNPDITEPRFHEFKAKFVQDLYAQYTLAGGLSVFAGVNNLADVQPDLGEVFYPVSGVGRFFFAGLEYRL
ncbi:TonB-dependent receptor domain-containing protein [Panacagrimonas sp.]|uniref:TonB-dependent receptor domain-containing protein n=1 Tax=Panacagrimonas sp. TaxID=2480088 RepID=UPI003B52EFB0